MTRVIALILTVFVAVACTAKVRTPEAEVKIPGVSVEVGDSGNDGEFCPPGQAKKGRC